MRSSCALFAPSRPHRISRITPSRSQRSIIQVLGGENIDAKDEDTAIRGFVNHIVELASVPMLADAERVLVIPEANLAGCVADLRSRFAGVMEANRRTRMFEHVKLFDRLEWYREKRRGNAVGVWTSKQSKSKIARMFESVVSRHRLRFLRTLVCSGGRGTDFRHQLVTQIQRYTRDIEINQRGEVVGEHYSGKKSGRDDLCIAIQIALYYGEVDRQQRMYGDG